MKRLQIIEALRGLAALSVAMFHFCSQFNSPFSAFVTAYGWLGVDVFFVLSGFVIAFSLSRSTYALSDYPRFLAKRLVRLEPPYILSIALVLVLAYASSLAPGFSGHPPHYSPSQIAAHLFYLVPLTHLEWANPVYWSLAYEFCFYLMAGLLFPFVGRRHAVVLLVTGGFAEFAYWELWGGVNVRVWEFVVGAVLMRMIDDRTELSGIFALVLACSVVALIGSPSTVLVVVVTVGAILVFRDAEVAPWLLYLGTLSYSLYLIHVPIGGRVVNLGKRLGTGPWIEAAIILAAIAVSLAAAVVFYWCVESRALAASRRIKYGARGS